METKYFVHFSLVIVYNIYFHAQCGNNNNNHAEEIICNHCCSRDVFTIFTFRRCSSGILSNNTFAQCNDVETIFILCTFGTPVNLEIKFNAFQNLKALTSVYISFYNIHFLPDRVFCNLKELTKLNLANTAIKDIYNKGFGKECGEDDNSSSLTDILLNSNEIQLLRNNTFIRLQNANIMDISNNHLVEIEEEAFNGLNNLSSLLLSYNRLSFLPENVFKNLKSLRELRVDSNRIVTTGLPNLKYLENLSFLRLDYNFIQNLNTNLLPETVTKLNISRNPLQIHNNTFRSLPKLFELNISNANLTHIDTNAFSNFTSLENLNLTQNHLNNIEKKLLKNCPIKYLDLSGNKMASLPDLNTTSLSGLTFLTLSYNFIRNIDKICLDVPSTNMTMLDLSFNEIESINDSFQCFVSLQALQLSNNRIQVTVSTKFMAPPDLRELLLDYNEITSVSRSVFHCPKCEFLSLVRNNISMISIDVITNYTRLLNVSHNNIQNGGVTGKFHFLNDLEEHLGYGLYDLLINSELHVRWKRGRQQNLILDISFNKLTKVMDEWQWSVFTEIHANDNLIDEIGQLYFHVFSDYQYYKIYLHNNNLSQPCFSKIYPITTTLKNNPLTCTCELDYFLFPITNLYKRISVVDLNEVKCRNPFSKLSSGYQFVTTLNKPQNMLCNSDYKHDKSCTCDHGMYFGLQCHFECPSPCQCYNNRDASFAIIDCSLINITSVPLINIRNVVLDVYLDGNDIKVIDQHSFKFINHIRKLYLNNSQVEFIYSNAFVNFNALQLLNISNNRIKTISPSVFYHLTSLNQLDISNNELSNLSIEIFSSLKNIQILNLNKNSLKHFSFWNLNLSDKVELLSIRDNPWSCECGFVVEFLKWSSDYFDIIDSKDAISCRDVSGKYRPMKIDEFSHCYNTALDVTPIWASVLAATCVIGLIAGLTFYYRREMQVLIYSRYHVRLFYKQNDDDDKGKLFDVFLAYSGDDEEFVVRNFLPGLENIERPYKTCVHNRDFVAGGYITENIMEAVQLSRRTLIVLTENFVKSEWCRFEFKTAHSEMLRDPRNRVIVVVVNDIPTNVDKELQLYLKTKTYLTWDDRLFWKRLYFVLPDQH